MLKIPFKSPSGLPIEIWVTSDFQDLSAIWPSSNSLGDAHCYVFQCADFLKVWCDTMGRERNTECHFVALVAHPDRVLALLPLGIERHSGIRILSFLDGGVCDYNSPVLFPGSGELDDLGMESILQQLKLALPRFDAAILDKMPRTIGGVPNPLLPASTAQSGESGYLTYLPRDWNVIAKKLPFAQDSRRNTKRLSERGNLQFKVASTSDERVRFLQAMIEQKSRRYVETRGFNGFDRPGYRSFFEDATSQLAGTCLHVSALTLDEQILATHWGYLVGRRFYYMMPSYEGGDWRRYSPGRLLQHHLIEWCVKNGVEIFDHGIGDEDYKKRYSDETVPLHRIELPITLQGRLYLLGQGARRSMRERGMLEPFKPLVRRVRSALGA